MRAKKILVGLAGALFFTIGAPSVAGALPTVGACMAKLIDKDGVQNVEAVLAAGLASGASEEAEGEILALEKELERCLESPSPIIPDVEEIIWGGAAFAILLGLMVWKGFPAVKKAMNDRENKIAADLDAADTAKVEALAVKAGYEAEVADAKAEGNRIIEEARQQAETVRADLQAKAEADIAELRVNAAADVEVARGRAMADLQTEVSDIVVGAAERVVEANLDRDAQVQLIENYINQVGSK